MLLFSAIAANLLAALPAALCGAVLLLLLWVTISGRDAWPFSSYPMFATYRDKEGSGYYRLDFVLPDGSRAAPPAALADLADEFDRTYRRLRESSNAQVAQSLAIALVSRFSAACQRLDPTLSTTVSLEVWERSVDLDQCIARFAGPLPLSQGRGV